MNEIIKTKFGNAKIDNKGYYRITTSKEGNFNKLLHRLIWEEYYGKPIPKGYDIHHINLDKRDNRIQNLQCVEHSKHISFHKKGKTLSDEHKRKISENNARYWKDKKRLEISKVISKYTLWNPSIVHYHKGDMFQYNRTPNPCKCFRIKYNSHDLPIGGFHDFVTCEIINELIQDAIK